MVRSHTLSPSGGENGNPFLQAEGALQNAPFCCAIPPRATFPPCHPERGARPRTEGSFTRSFRKRSLGSFQSLGMTQVGRGLPPKLGLVPRRAPMV